MKYIACILLLLSVPLDALAVTEALHPKEMEWSFAGNAGRVDKVAAQRGFQVYKEVCSACHSLKRVAFRNLSQIGFSEAEVKTLAATYNIPDGPNDEGEMFEQIGRAHV